MDTLQGSMEQKKDRQQLDTDQKALEINLNDRIYGTFAEIGAGQEVARIFFKVGAAAGTIAKTMSAYDKVFSDTIYGPERSNRYVCETRLYKMLEREYRLVEERLRETKPHSTFFAFADTVRTLDYERTITGDGWLGVRFQLDPQSPPNDFVLHVKMFDNDTQLQQSAIGVLGVNMMYACFNYADNAEDLIHSLLDGIRGRVQIDMIRLTGPDFKNVDNRWLNLLMVQFGLTKVAIFGPDKRSIHASEFLYKKSALVAGGNFRPPTLVTVDVFEKSFRQFLNEPGVEAERTELLAELTLDYLRRDNGEISKEDFLARCEVLGAMDKKVIVSDCTRHSELIDYLSDYKINNLGLVIGVRELSFLISEKYHEHKNGALLQTFGQLFSRNIKVYAYPALTDELDQLITLENLPLPEGIRFLVKFLVENEFIVPVYDYNPDILEILPYKVLEMIYKNEPGWEKFVPEPVVEVIKDKGLFKYETEKAQMEF